MSHLVRRRLRVPQADGAALIDPPPAAFDDLIAANRTLAAHRNYDCQGFTLDQLAMRARDELLASAAAYCQTYRDVSFVRPFTPATNFVLAGHQPELFHPGVWFKNFLLASAAQQSGGVAVNLIVDTDTVRTASIRVPVRDGEQAAFENVPYDTAWEPVAFEERPILDRWMFESFGRRVRAVYETCCVGGREPFVPLVEELWHAAASQARAAGSGGRLGLVLAQARHGLEWRLGLNTVELPLSQVAQNRNFRWFAVHLLAELPRLWRIYNAALEAYRHANHIRSHTHPVPGLAQHHDWLEAPFLIWSRDRLERRHLFVMQQPGALILSDRQGLQVSLEIEDGNLGKAVEQLIRAESRGVKIRPRALITTMYARLVLSDLFIHGIGGAKYDELTDLIIRRFFRIEPPAYVTATATFRLPIDRPEVTIDDLRAGARQLRDLRYRPEALLHDPRVANDAALAPKLAALAAEKREYLDRHDLRRCSPDVFDRLDRLNRAMHELLLPIEDESRAQHAELVAQLKQSQLLGSREFSFVLFPSEILPARLLDLCKVVS